MRDIEDLPDTEFHRQLQIFRAERAEKNLLPDSNITNLYIPGKIVHLVDTKGDGSAYIPYWADRYNDFNQVIISKRMKSDHSMMDLVDILRGLRMHGHVGKSISTTFYNSMNIAEVEVDKDADIRLFMCCSNPDGMCPILLSLIAIAALSLSWWTTTLCNFLSRESTILVNGVKFYDIPFSIGLYSYTLLQCEDGNCDSAEENVIPSDVCIPYPDGGDNWHMQASRAFAAACLFFGSMSFFLLCISTCLSLRRWAWKMITCMFLLTSLFQGLVFMMKQSILCITVDNSEGVTIDSKCKLSTGAIEAIIAGCLYFITAIGSMHFTRAKRDGMPSENGVGDGAWS